MILTFILPRLSLGERDLFLYIFDDYDGALICLFARVELVKSVSNRVADSDQFWFGEDNHAVD